MGWTLREINPGESGGKNNQLPAGPKPRGGSVFVTAKSSSKFVLEALATARKRGKPHYRLGFLLVPWEEASSAQVGDGDGGSPGGSGDGGVPGADGNGMLPIDKNACAGGDSREEGGATSTTTGRQPGNGSVNGGELERGGDKGEGESESMKGEQDKNTKKERQDDNEGGGDRAIGEEEDKGGVGEVVAPDAGGAVEAEGSGDGEVTLVYEMYDEKFPIQVSELLLLQSPSHRPSALPHRCSVPVSTLLFAMGAASGVRF